MSFARWRSRDIQSAIELAQPIARPSCLLIMLRFVSKLPFKPILFFLWKLVTGVIAAECGAGHGVSFFQTYPVLTSDQNLRDWLRTDHRQTKGIFRPAPAFTTLS